MARTPQDRKNTQRDRPGQRPLLQGHLRRRSGPAVDAPPADSEPEAIPERVGLPGAERSQGEADAVRSKATRSKATRSPTDDAKRPKLEGPEQAPA